MKQGRIYNKLILGILLAAVVLYLAIAALRPLFATPLTTVQAIAYEAGAGCRATGYIVRDELVLTSPYAIAAITRREGERVGVGQTVATGYQSSDARNQQGEIERVEAELEQLRFAWAYEGDAADPAGMDQEVVELFTLCARQVARRELAAAAEQTPRLKGLLLRSASGDAETAAIGTRIASLEDELSSLRSRFSNSRGSVTAPVSGCFSGTADGFEQALTPARLETMTLTELDSLTPAPVPDNACGRLVCSSDWYFVCAVPSENLKEVEEGDVAQTGFTNSAGSQIPMVIERIGDEEDGRRLLVLSCADYVQDMTLPRRQTVELVFRSYEGLRVPKTALVMDAENRPSVYVLENGQSRSKDVRILYDNGESYVVALDKTDTGNLWPGDEIIINPRNLFDGKVVTIS